MSFTRSLNKQICRVLAGVLLFAQLAVTAYACPSVSGMKSTPVGSSMSSMAMDGTASQGSMDKSTAMSPDCDQIDQNAANLCSEHCRFGQQSADTASVPTAFAAIPALLYSLPLEPEPVSGSVRSLPALDAVIAAPLPPHAILHCVFRI